MRSLFIVILVPLILAVNTSVAQDDLEDIGPDGTPVTSRVIDGITVTISPQGGLPLTARTYNAEALVAFNGGDNQPNTPLNPENVSGNRFISNVGDGINFANAQPITFEFDQPITHFGLTTLDLLEDGEVGAEIMLQAFDQADNLIDEHSRSGPQGQSGLDLDWMVSGNGNIVKVLLTGSLAGGFSGYGIDDLVLNMQVEPPGNRPPFAIHDEFLYLDYFRNSPSVLHVLENDFDPDGDTIRIHSVDEPGRGGIIMSYSDSTITYSIDQPLRRGQEQDLFFYTITDGQDTSTADVSIFLCLCPLECLQVFVPPSGNASKGRAQKISNTSAADSLDVDLFRRFRDETLLPSETGTHFVDLYYRSAPEVVPLLIFARPDIGGQAFTALGMMQEPVRNLLEEDGDMPVTQTLIDTVSAFLDNLTAVMSDSLRDALNAELTRLGPLQDLVGLSVAEAVGKAIGDSVATGTQHDRSVAQDHFILEQNFPNPFNPFTQIVYKVRIGSPIKLVIYNIQGREIRTLVNELQTVGDKSVTWDGTDYEGRKVPSGVYFYRLSTSTSVHTKKMLLMR